jgi:V/A-type H+-transporting ATPase subunit K
MAVTITVILLVLSIAVPFGAYFLSARKTMRRGKILLLTNMGTFFATLLAATVALFAGAASAETEAAVQLAGVTAAGDFTYGFGFLSAALSTGLACIGAGVAVAASSSTALGAISEDPKLMGKSMIYVALSEGIAIYGLLISIIILNKIPPLF